MNLSHIYIKDDKIKIDNVNLETAIERIWFSHFAGLMALINAKGKQAYYDLYGADVVKELHKKYGFKKAF